MNRADRRRQEKACKSADAQRTAVAAKRYAQDVRRDGVFDAQAALRDPYYMEQIRREREAQLAAWNQNGITREDLKAEYEKGYAAARKDLATFTMRMFYAALAISLHRLYKFGEGRIIRTLDAVQWTMTEEICTADILARCKQETGLDILDTDYDN